MFCVAAVRVCRLDISSRLLKHGAINDNIILHVLHLLLVHTTQSIFTALLYGPVIFKFFQIRLRQYCCVTSGGLALSVCRLSRSLCQTTSIACHMANS